jgi:hypothetical protein
MTYYLLKYPKDEMTDDSICPKDYFFTSPEQFASNPMNRLPFRNVPFDDPNAEDFFKFVDSTIRLENLQNAFMQAYFDNTRPPIPEELKEIVFQNPHSTTQHYSFSVKSTRPANPFRGIPPMHRFALGENPMLYWLPDSGTTTHMTPFLLDIDPGSFVPYETFIRVANNQL